MFKAILFFLASLGIIDGDNDQQTQTDVKERTEVRAVSSNGGSGATKEDDDDDNKHSTKEGL